MWLVSWLVTLVHLSIKGTLGSVVGLVSWLVTPAHLSIKGTLDSLVGKLVFQ